MPSTQKPRAKKRRHPSLAKNLLWWRLTRRMNLRELGKASGIAFSKIGSWERGKKEPAYEDLCHVAEALQVPIQHLWDHVGTPADEPEPLQKGRKSQRVHVSDSSTRGS